MTISAAEAKRYRKQAIDQDLTTMNAVDEMQVLFTCMEDLSELLPAPRSPSEEWAS